MQDGGASDAWSSNNSLVIGMCLDFVLEIGIFSVPWIPMLTPTIVL
jgi:hypothetical protein